MQKLNFSNRKFGPQLGDAMNRHNPGFLHPKHF